MEGIFHYAEVLQRNFVDDKQPPGHAALPEEPVTSKSSFPSQHSPPNQNRINPRTR